jgi:hypothetical protein
MHMIEKLDVLQRQKITGRSAIRRFANPIDVDPARTSHETQTQKSLLLTNKSINMSLKFASPNPAERRNLACGHKLIGV